MTITAFSLTSPNTQSGAPFMLGQVFKRGDVPSGSYVTADLANCSVIPLRRWNDGSLKIAAIVGRVNLTANTERQVNLTTTTTAPSGVALTAADIASLSPEASVQMGSFGTVTLASLLATPLRTYISSPEMVECHYQASVDADPLLYVIFHVRLFANGAIWIRAIGGNGYLGGAKTQKDYIPTVTIGGTTRWDNSGGAYHHSPLARWDITGWVGTDPQVTPRHDTGYMSRSKMVPNYWKAATTAAVNAWAAKSNYVPGANLGFTESMGATGYQDQIGLLPLWDALYITSQGSPTMYNAVVAHARAINSYGISWVDQTNRNPIKPSAFPNWSGAGAGQGGLSGTSTVKQNLASNLVWEGAHFPSSGYMAYLLTADYYYLEAAINTAITVYLTQDLNGGLGVNRLVRGQNRGRGWAYRAISQAAAIYPDSLSSLFGELSTWFASISSQKVAIHTSAPLSTVWIGYDDMFNNRLDWNNSLAPNGQIVAETAPWEHHFTTMSMGMASDIEPCDASGMISVNQWRDYLHGAPVWITGGTSSSEYNFGYAANYTVNVRISSKSNGTFDPVSHTKWIATDPGMIFRDTFSTSSTVVDNPGTNTLTGSSGGQPSGSTGYWGNLFPALAYAADHGKEGAIDGFNRITGASNFSVMNNTEWASNPIWGIVPRSYSQLPDVFTLPDDVPPATGEKLKVGTDFFGENTLAIGPCGFGVLGQNISLTGQDGPSPFANDRGIDFTDREFRARIKAKPAFGKPVFTSNGGLDYDGLPNGSHVLRYELVVDQVARGEADITIAVGASSVVLTADSTALSYGSSGGSIAQRHVLQSEGTDLQFWTNGGSINVNVPPDGTVVVLQAEQTDMRYETTGGSISVSSSAMTLTPADVQAIADAVWEKQVTSVNDAGTFGKLMGSIMTVAKFLQLK